MEKKLCLITEVPSHYRKLIYSVLEEEMGCEFIVSTQKGSIKRIDKNALSHVVEVNVKYLGDSHWYFLKGAMKPLSQYDVILNDLGIYSLTAWMILIKSKFTGQKVYNWSHGWYGREGFVKKWFKRMYHGLATGSFIYGDYAIRLMKENGFDERKLFPIHNSLDYDAHVKIRASIQPSDVYQKHFGNNFPVLLFIGRLTKVKCLNMLIDALALLRDRGEMYNLVFVGGGDLQSSLEQQAEDLSVKENVWFYGACYDEHQNAGLIFNADLCVAPGNIGLTAIYAMAFGCPCVSHNTFEWQMPEFETIHEGVTGSFFEQRSVPSLADCISRWFAEKADKREDVRKACYKEIDNSWNPYYQMDILRKNLNLK